MASGSSFAEVVEAEEMVGVGEEPWFPPEVEGIEKVQPHWVWEQHEHLSSDDVVERVDQMAGVGVDYSAAVEVGENLVSFGGVAVDDSYYAVGADNGDYYDAVEDSDVAVDEAVDDELDNVAAVEVGAEDVEM